MRGAPLLLCALAVASCRPPPLSLSAPATADADDYWRLHRHHTRRADVYDGVESRFFVAATWLSPRFGATQSAYRQREERLVGPDATSLPLVAADEVAFFVALHTNEWGWNHLERTGSGGLFTTRLVTASGEALVPSQIERVGDDPRYETLYPDCREYFIGYVVRFASAGPRLRASDNHFTLRLSAFGRAADLDWELAP